MKCNFAHLVLVSALVAGTILSSCVPAGLDESKPSSLPAPTVAPAVEPTPLATLKVVSYNVLFGAGWDRAYDENMPERFRGIDRTPLLIEYLKTLDADIVGLQETTGWDQGSPPYIETIARELGMSYFVSTGRSDTALLTKLEIVEADDLSSETTSIIRARMLGPSGEPVNVYVAHLNGDSMEERSCSTQFMLRDAEPHADQWTFLIGDMNFKAKPETEWSPNALREAGWRLVAADRSLGLDQIWAPAALQWAATAWSAAQGSYLKQLSDHSPVGIELQLLSPSADEVPLSEPTPAQLPGLHDLPKSVSDAVIDARVAFTQTADVPCNEQRWRPYFNNVNMKGIDLHLYGEEDWISYANWSEFVGENEGMLLDFKYEPGSEFNIFLEHGEWAAPEFRKFGMLIDAGGRLRADVWTGPNQKGDAAWTGTSSFAADTWYRLLLAVGNGGRLAAFVWEIGDPSNLSVMQGEMGADWYGVPLRLSVGGNRGGVDIHGVTQIVFERLQ